MSLTDYWYIAALSSEVGKRPVSRVIMGERLVVYRDDSGTACVLEDRCAHRNMALSHGKVVDGHVECPYHGWRYDGTGICVHVPSLGAGAKLPRMCVRAYETRERDGYVWMYAGAGAPESEPFRFPHCDQPGWTTFRMKTRFAGSVENCLENFLDCPHTVYVHSGWFRSRDTREVRAITRELDGRVEVEFQDEPINKSLAFRLFAPKAGSQMRHTDAFIMPNVSRVDYDFGPGHHFIITSQCTPIADDDTEVYTVVSYQFGRLGPLVRLVFEPMCRRIIRQDVDVMRVQAEQIRHFGGPKFRHVETDLLGLRIHAMRHRAEHPESSPPVTRESEREIRIRF
jgi:phenylpropionate dioxygenase-like ring-hydroxylating dioxygenase large terminal subunit